MKRKQLRVKEKRKKNGTCNDIVLYLCNINDLVQFGSVLARPKTELNYFGFEFFLVQFILDQIGSAVQFSAVATKLNSSLVGGRWRRRYLTSLTFFLSSNLDSYQGLITLLILLFGLVWC